MIQTVLELLRCPRCGKPFVLADRSLRCLAGHAFDVARQGYVNLTGAAPPAHADTPAMVTARADLLSSGRYAAVIDAVVGAVPTGARDVLDVGVGTGHYAAAVLAERAACRALGLDVSVAACRRAARAHARLGVVTADAWLALPVIDGAVDVVLSVFAPRNALEFVRVLRPGGLVITVTPQPAHLVELRNALGLLDIEPDKQTRLTEAFGRAGLRRLDHVGIDQRELWSLDDAVRSVVMGPNAFHAPVGQVRMAAEQLDWPQPVTVAAEIIRWRRDPAADPGC